MCSIPDEGIDQFLAEASRGPPGTKFTYEIRFRPGENGPVCKTSVGRETNEWLKDDLRDDLTEKLWPPSDRISSKSQSCSTSSSTDLISAEEVTPLEEVVRRQKQYKRRDSTTRVVTPVSDKPWTEKTGGRVRRQKKAVDELELACKLEKLQLNTADSDFMIPRCDDEIAIDIDDLLSLVSNSTTTSDENIGDRMKQIPV